MYAFYVHIYSGCFAALFPVILVDLLGIDMIEKSLGQELACASIGFLPHRTFYGQLWSLSSTGPQVSNALEMTLRP